MVAGNLFSDAYNAIGTINYPSSGAVDFNSRKNVVVKKSHDVFIYIVALLIVYLYIAK